MMAKLVNFFGDKKYTRTRWRLLIAILVCIVITDFLVARPHDYNFWDTIPGWGALLGFIGCGMIILVSKLIGKKVGLSKKENYYD